MSGTWPLARRRIADHFNGAQLRATLDIVYDGEAGGPFTLGETVTFGGGGTGTVDEVVDTAPTGVLTVQMVSGTNPADDETITGAGSGATAVVNGTPAGLAAETLAFYPRMPDTPQTKYPYGYILPRAVKVNRYPGSMREEISPVLLRFMLAPVGETTPRNLHRRYDGWLEVIFDLWDSAAQIDDSVDISVEQETPGLGRFRDIDLGFGFEMTFANVRITREKTFSA